MPRPGGPADEAAARDLDLGQQARAAARQPVGAEPDQQPRVERLARLRRLASTAAGCSAATRRASRPSRPSRRSCSRMSAVPWMTTASLRSAAEVGELLELLHASARCRCGPRRGGCRRRRPRRRRPRSRSCPTARLPKSPEAGRSPRARGAGRRSLVDVAHELLGLHAPDVLARPLERGHAADERADLRVAQLRLVAEHLLEVVLRVADERVVERPSRATRSGWGTAAAAPRRRRR